jgi:membrane-bound acyltransferase YfiQ involved in biofilm formation
VFLIGFLLAHSTDFWQAVERQRWIALVVAVALYAVFISLRSMSGGGMPVRITAVTAYGCYQWLCMVAVLGFARRWLNTDSRARRYLTNAIFPYYIVHQTAIIMIAHSLQSSGLSAGAEAAIVIGGTAITCIVTFEIVRRVAWLRPLFGLKRLEAASVVGLRASGQAAR